MFRCRTCGVYYTAPQQSDEEIERYYSVDYIPDARVLETDFSDRRSAALNRAAEVVQQRVHTGSILDVGCAGGAFLQRFSDDRWQKFGVEPSEYACEQLSEQGVHAFAGLFPDAVSTDLRFDVITILDLIMIVPRPDDVLRAAHELLASDGLLAVEFAGFLWRFLTHVGPLPVLRGRGWTDLNLDIHLFFFPDRVIRNMLAEHGFEVVGVEMLAPSDAASGALTRLLSWWNRMLGEFPPTASGRVSLAPKYLYLARPRC